MLKNVPCPPIYSDPNTPVTSAEQPLPAQSAPFPLSQNRFGVWAAVGLGALTLYCEDSLAQADPTKASVTLAWDPYNAGQPNAGLKPDDYVVVYGHSPSAMNTLHYVGGFTNMTTIETLERGKDYYFVCRAVKHETFGNLYSLNSNMVSYSVPPLVAGAPLLSNFTVVPDSVGINHRGEGQVAVSFQVAEGTLPLRQFKFYRSLGESGQAYTHSFIHNNPNDRQITIAGFLPGETYRLRIAPVHEENGKLVEGRIVPTTLTFTTPTTSSAPLKPNPLAGREPVENEWVQVDYPGTWSEDPETQPNADFEVSQPHFQSLRRVPDGIIAELSATPGSWVYIIADSDQLVYHGETPPEGRLEVRLPLETNARAQLFHAVAYATEVPDYKLSE